MEIVNKKHISNEKLRNFFQTHWGSPQMVISSGIYDCSELDGFAVKNAAGEITGLITYVIRNHDCEIISLDSIEEGKGIGTLLVQETERLATREGCKILTLVTTNDNLKALKFWQKRGFVLTELLADAVQKARKNKPEIPIVGYYGIPIRDELVLEKKINRNAQ